jgi:hypothetical protein
MTDMSNPIMDNTIVQGLLLEVKRLNEALEWQPIETAPKDGTIVLLVIDHGKWGEKVWTGLWDDGWMVIYGKARNAPTHWMPLPAPPAAIDAAIGRTE